MNHKTTLDQAREFDAVKIEEVVDKDKLKKLFERDLPIPEISLDSIHPGCSSKS